MDKGCGAAILTVPDNLFSSINGKTIILIVHQGLSKTLILNLASTTTEPPPQRRGRASAPPIAPIAPTAAVAFTINHIAAVVLPAIGGALWMLDYRIPFIGGAVMSLVSLIAVQMIRTPIRINA